jgi:hypothetical protein
VRGIDSSANWLYALDASLPEAAGKFKTARRANRRRSDRPRHRTVIVRPSQKTFVFRNKRAKSLRPSPFRSAVWRLLVAEVKRPCTRRQSKRPPNPYLSMVLRGIACGASLLLGIAISRGSRSRKAHETASRYPLTSRSSGRIESAAQRIVRNGIGEVAMADKNEEDDAEEEPREMFCPMCDEVRELDEHGKCRGCGEQILRDPNISD